MPSQRRSRQSIAPCPSAPAIRLSRQLPASCGSSHPRACRSPMAHCLHSAPATPDCRRKHNGSHSLPPRCCHSTRNSFQSAAASARHTHNPHATRSSPTRSPTGSHRHRQNSASHLTTNSRSNHRYSSLSPANSSPHCSWPNVRNCPAPQLCSCCSHQPMSRSSAPNCHPHRCPPARCSIRCRSPSRSSRPVNNLDNAVHWRCRPPSTSRLASRSSVHSMRSHQKVHPSAITNTTLLCTDPFTTLLRLDCRNRLVTSAAVKFQTPVHPTGLCLATTSVEESIYFSPLKKSCI